MVNNAINMVSIKWWFHTWHWTCDIIGSILSGSVVSLWVVLIKLSFENTEQAGDPVVQPYVQNELKKTKNITHYGLRVSLQENTIFLKSYLQDLNDLELCVHDHDIFSLRFNLSFNHITLRLMSWCCGQQTASSQHHLGHQLPNSMNGLHHITSTCGSRDGARKRSNLHKRKIFVWENFFI